MESNHSNTGISKNEKRLLNNTFILAIGTISSKFIVLLMVPLYSRWMTTEDYGSFDLFYTYLSLLVPIFTLSCGESVFRFLLDKHDSIGKSEIISTGGFVCIMGSTVCVIGSIIFFSILNIDCLVPFILLVVTDILNSYVGYTLRGLQKLKQFAVMGIINVFFMTLSVTLFVRFLGLGLPGMMYGYAVGMSFSVFYGVLAGKIHQYWSNKTVNQLSLKSMIKYSAPLIPNAISWWVTNGSDRFIINIYLGVAANGIYAMAYKMPSICTTLFSVFHLSWQENASLSVQEEGFSDYFITIYNKLIKRAISICVIILSTNYLIFTYIIDKRYCDAYYYVPILVFSVLFSFMAQFIGGIFIAYKNTKVNAVTTIIVSVINIVVHLALVKSIGLYAAAISTLVSYLVLFLLRLVISQRMVRLRIQKKIIPYFGFISYYMVAQYINMRIMNHINLAVSVLFFIFVNKDMLVEYYYTLRNRLHLS